MLSTVLQILRYLLLGLGLFLVLFAYPLAYGVLFRYGGDIGDAIGNSGLASYTGYFVAVFLTIPLFLAGLYLWRSQWRFLNIEERISKNIAAGLAFRLRLQQFYCAVVLVLTALSPLATLLGLGIVGLMVLFEDIDTPMPGNLKLALHTSALVELGLAVCEFAIAFVVARSFWRLLQSARTNRIVERRPIP